MKTKKTVADPLFSITFDPKCYTGTYRVLAANGDVLSSIAGAITLRLHASSYFVLVGSGSFAFTITGKGQIAKLDPTAPATITGADKNRLAFKNETIIVEPGKYDGAYYPAGHYDIPIHGRQEVVVVPNMGWYIDVYGTYAGTQLSFQVDSLGKIDTASVSPKGAAVAAGNLLSFQTTQITVDPVDFNADYILAGHYCEASNGVLNFPVVKALACYIEFYGCGWNNEVVFKVDDQGHINQADVSNTQAVTAVNLPGPGATAKLIVNTQAVKISTEYPRVFRIGSRSFDTSLVRKGKKHKNGNRSLAPFVMVKNVTTFISIVENVYTLITPCQTAMVPAVAFVEGPDGASVEFDFSY